MIYQLGHISDLEKLPPVDGHIYEAAKEYLGILDVGTVPTGMFCMATAAFCCTARPEPPILNWKHISVIGTMCRSMRSRSTAYRHIR